MSGGYYLRQLFFGLLIALALHGLNTRLPLPSPGLGPTGWLLVSVVNTLLYPYARLLYEGLWDFILGDQVYYLRRPAATHRAGFPADDDAGLLGLCPAAGPAVRTGALAGWPVFPLIAKELP